jgi:hypothetical protein
VKGRLKFTPHADGHYTFEGIGTVKPLLAGAIRKGSSPAETDHEWIVKFEGFHASRAA